VWAAEGRCHWSREWGCADRRMLDGRFSPSFVDSQESTKHGKDLLLQSADSDPRATISECPPCAPHVLTVITTAFIEHPSGTGL
jgi:hypothetical protein